VAYCTLADILDKIPESEVINMTDDEGEGVVNQGRVNDAIADAQALIDSYAGKRHNVPLDPVPRVIQRAACVIAIYNLFARRLGAPEEWQRRHEAQVRWLRDLADGKVTLGGGDPTGTPNAEPVLAQSQTRIFSRDTLKDF
jgi:phage gp36-like protein